MADDQGHSPTTARPVHLLASQVRNRRKALGLRQADLADLAGCSQRFVHTVENGKTTVRLDKLLDVLEVLGLEMVVERREARSGRWGSPSRQDEEE